MMEDEEYIKDMLIRTNNDSVPQLGRPGTLEMSYNYDDDLDYRLAEMASKAHNSVIRPYQYFMEDDPVRYERRKLEMDGHGGWKDGRYKQKPEPGFHFLEYASKNFKNPIDMIKKATGFGGSPSGTNITTVADNQQ